MSPFMQSASIICQWHTSQLYSSSSLVSSLVTTVECSYTVGIYLTPVCRHVIQAGGCHTLHRAVQITGSNAETETIDHLSASPCHSKACTTKGDTYDLWSYRRGWREINSWHMQIQFHSMRIWLLIGRLWEIAKRECEMISVQPSNLSGMVQECVYSVVSCLTLHSAWQLVQKSKYHEHAHPSQLYTLQGHSNYLWK